MVLFEFHPFARVLYTTFGYGLIGGFLRIAFAPLNNRMFKLSSKSSVELTCRGLLLANSGKESEAPLPLKTWHPDIAA